MTNAYTFKQDFDRLPDQVKEIIYRVAQAYADCPIDSYHYAGLQNAMQMIVHCKGIDHYSTAEIVNYLIELELISPNIELYDRIFHA